MLSRYKNLFRHTAITLCLYACTLLFSTSAISQEPQIAVYKLNGLINQQQTGSYNKLLKRIQALNVSFHLQYSPIIRAKHNFKLRLADCIAPSDEDGTIFNFPPIQSEPFNYAKGYVFTRHDDDTISDLQALKGKKVGVRTGMRFSAEFEQLRNSGYFEVEQVRDIALNYRKLIAKRIDAFAAYTPDIWVMLNNKELSQLHYDASHTMQKHSERVVCHASPSNQVFIDKFNLALQQLKQQGELKKLLGIAYTFDN